MQYIGVFFLKKFIWYQLSTVFAVTWLIKFFKICETSVIINEFFILRYQDFRKTSPSYIFDFSLSRSMLSFSLFNFGIGSSVSLWVHMTPFKWWKSILHVLLAPQFLCLLTFDVVDSLLWYQRRLGIKSVFSESPFQSFW